MVEVEDDATGRGGPCAMEADDDTRDQIDREREGERGREGRRGEGSHGGSRGGWGSCGRRGWRGRPKINVAQKSVHVLFFLVVEDLIYIQ